MSNLVLDSLEIENFRAFRHLKINHLGRVNLVVGKNNVGKTCLLEALMLYAGKGEPVVILGLLEKRNELRSSSGKRVYRSLERAEERFSALQLLFHGRNGLGKAVDPIRVGPVGFVGDTITVKTVWSSRDDVERGWRLIEVDEPETQAVRLASIPGMTVEIGQHMEYHFPLDQDYSPRFFRNQPFVGEIHCVSVEANGLDSASTALMWDNVALSNLENDVLSALRIIAPSVSGVNLLGHEGSRQRIPFIRAIGYDAPLPLRSMGEGMNRIFGLALALVNAKDGLLLIDEIDTGIHYSVQPDMWRLIFEVAHRLNVQVFATSHSWDCIQAFQQAADENTQEEGVLIRLQNKNGDVVPVLFDEEELNVVAREMIEVR